MNVITDKKGLTLVELLVYIMLAVFLLAPIMLLMHSSSLNMTRDSVNVDLRVTGRDILNIMYDDLKNTGFKIVMPNILETSDSVLVCPHPACAADTTNANLSSIEPVDGGTTGKTGAGDELTIYKGVLNSAGTLWVGYDEITYSVDSVRGDPLDGTGILVREIVTCRANATGGYDCDNHPDTTVIASNIEALQFQYADSSMSNWFNGNQVAVTGGAIRSRDVRYVKIILILRDNKPVGALASRPAETIANYNMALVDKSIQRERFEMVVPIPNNGLFPPPTP